LLKLLLTREAVSALVRMAATIAASLEITSLRSSVEDEPLEEARAVFKTDLFRSSGGGEEHSGWLVATAPMRKPGGS
jgi:hypothetical protein